MKAVFFDLDGTLLDRDASIKEFSIQQYQRYYDKLSHIPQAVFTNRFKELDARGYVWKDKVYQQMEAEFTFQGIAAEDLLMDYLNHFHQSCVPFPHLIQTLSDLRDRQIKMGIISNGRWGFQMASIQALQVEEYFGVILISEREGISKPDPQIFHRAMDRLCVSPYESVFVGDHPVNDIEGSKRCGMEAVWKRDPNWNNTAVKWKIDDLKELPLLIDRMRGGEDDGLGAKAAE
ncbi:HAD family hydrolase [Bacillus infantis]|uniref:HAD family hydrolase n=1 Tax=Bacillus infantis TaxID=324767 RepID=A0A5D4SJA8_9BACI|nr:HAD family hydrolase [Bacillus infantis]MCK6207893.1 HAD family hydrolase [Bacillus infantis]MCP1156739.1 HAD family hydrolase [Bacillus infantis]OXT17579.1 L-2-haloalkanoic acid dehalogenase [Bacillus sp. OG2]TYS62222.1 HAD family hydrolase [Bacillus infantis]